MCTAGLSNGSWRLRHGGVLLLALGTVALGLSVYIVHERKQTVAIVQTAHNRLLFLVNAMRAYKEDYGRYPDGNTDQVLRTLRGENSRHRRYLVTFQPPGVYNDPWGRPYRIHSQDGCISIECAGANGIWGDTDDLTATRKEPSEDKLMDVSLE
jgi:hypothetical protein